MREISRLEEEMIADRAARAVEEARARIWMAVRTVLICLCWQALGIGAMVWGFHVNDPENGAIAVQGGAGIATVGTFLTLAISQLRRERKGYD
jgi:hypothetical protein